MSQVQIYYSPALSRTTRLYEENLVRILAEVGIPRERLKDDDPVACQYRVIFDPGNGEQAQSLVSRLNLVSGLCAKLVSNGRSL
jgi:hypothetical protein